MNLLTLAVYSSLVLFCFSNALADTISGKVVGISDGDSITVLDSSRTQHKIRLAGIDAPEKKQAFGNKSKQSLSNLIFNREVTIEYKKHDKYQRIVGKVLLDDQDINLEQIKLGMAWFYSKYKKELVFDDRIDYLHAHEDAKNAGIGLWSDPEAIPPWEFRKLSRDN